jgi:SAM-dependent methyltransferase
MPSSFDLHATEYDRWFLANENLLRSELALLARCLGPEPGRTLSVGCGSGLFERLLSSEYGIAITEGLEPSAPMAAIARERGLNVAERTAEAGAYGDAEFDTVLFNGTPGYIDDLAAALAAARRALRPGGRIVVLDVPKESGFGLLYNLAVACGDWDDPRVSDVKPPHPYPVAFAAGANWRTTAEKVALLEAAGFTDLEFLQTLTVHPVHADRAVEDPVPGHDRGGYVGIVGRLAEGSAS